MLNNHAAKGCVSEDGTIKPPIPLPKTTKRKRKESKSGTIAKLYNPPSSMLTKLGRNTAATAAPHPTAPDDLPSTSEAGRFVPPEEPTPSTSKDARPLIEEQHPRISGKDGIFKRRKITTRPEIPFNPYNSGKATEQGPWIREYNNTIAIPGTSSTSAIKPVNRFTPAPSSHVLEAYDTHAPVQKQITPPRSEVTEPNQCRNAYWAEQYTQLSDDDSDSNGEETQTVDTPEEANPSEEQGQLLPLESQLTMSSDEEGPQPQSASLTQTENKISHSASITLSQSPTKVTDPNTGVNTTPQPRGGTEEPERYTGLFQAQPTLQIDSEAFTGPTSEFANHPIQVMSNALTLNMLKLTQIRNTNLLDDSIQMMEILNLHLEKVLSSERSTSSSPINFDSPPTLDMPESL